MNPIVKILSSLACLAALAVPCFGQMLSLVDLSTGFSSETLAAGTTSLTLAVDLTGPSTVSVDEFAIELSGSNSAVTPLANGITLTSFTTTPLIQSNFSTGQSTANYEYGGTADSQSNDLQLSSTATTLVDVNFALSSLLTPNTPYTIDFAPTSNAQNLIAFSGSPIGYTETNFSFTTSPEPPASALLAVGGLAALAWRVVRRPKAATWG